MLHLLQGQVTISRVAAAVLFVMVVTGCGEATESTSAGAAAPVAIAVAWFDPEDDRHLVVGTDGCTEGAAAAVAEAEGRVEITVSAVEVALPCSPERVDVVLSSPLDGRTVLDGATGEELVLEEAAFLHPAPAPPRPVAACDGEAPSEAVRHEIDGGLQTAVVHCDDRWLVVDTSTNACAPTDGAEAPGDGCVGNAHRAFFEVRDGHWSIAGFDDCPAGLAEDPDVAPRLCDG